MLTPEQQRTLYCSILQNSYPKVAYDFDNSQEIWFDSWRDLEAYVRCHLLSGDVPTVRNGLLNVLYWGYFRNKGRLKSQTERFRKRVEEAQIQAASARFQRQGQENLVELVQDLTGFGSMSFGSKLRMFLEPSRFVVLDTRLGQLEPLLSRIRWGHNRKSMPIPSNEKVYACWSEACTAASKDTYFVQRAVIAVDIERGVFHLASEDRTRAEEILERLLSDASCKCND